MDGQATTRAEVDKFLDGWKYGFVAENEWGPAAWSCSFETREEAVAAARECGAVEIKGEPEYRYRIKSLGHSSARYGACEVCSQPVTEVFLQSEQRRYAKGGGEWGWTYADCRDSLFGHQACLLSARR